MKKLFVLLLSLMSLGSVAAEREFDVEVIIFKRAVEPENVNESWPNVLPEIDFTRVGTFNDDIYRKLNDIKVLPEEDYQLLEQKEALDKHAAFTVLMHQAWRQGDKPKATGPVFRVRAGYDYSQEFNADGSVKEADESLVTEVLPESDDITQGVNIEEVDIDQPLYELDGTFQVYVQHYLFLETTLDLKKPGEREVLIETPEQEVEAELPIVAEGELEMAGGTETITLDTLENPLEVAEPEAEETVQFGNLEAIEPVYTVEKFLKSYRFSQKRRMRSGEIHYLDHPLMGIIIKVTPAPKEETLLIQ